MAQSPTRTRWKARVGRSGTAALLIVGTLVGGGLAATGSAAASTGGDSNKGDVWVDNVGQPAGPGHEMDPHLSCANINLWGNGLADAGGSYTIDGWPPSGTQQQAYSSTWQYNGATGGDQVTDVINVQTLVANAVKNGDAPVNKQGFHFKLQFVQDPQKHKTFWVDCPMPPPPPPPPSTGFLEICKKAASGAVTGNFQFVVKGVTYTVPVGACSPAISLPAGNVTITELARSGFALTGVTTSPSGRLVSTSLATRSAVVKIVAGSVATQTIATFTNSAVPPPPTGYLEICKKAATGAVTGNFQFVVKGVTYTVPVGACSPAISLPAGNVTITELARSGFALTGVTTSPSGRLVSTSLATRSAVVKIVAGSVATQTIATFTNSVAPPGTGTVKVCEVAGSGVAVGTNFPFTVGGKSVTVPAGPAPGGYCVVVPGTFTIGSHVTVTQAVPSGDSVSSIGVAPVARAVSTNPGTGTAVVNVGSGVTEVTYTDTH
jgi:hypothetical protein